ncbi:hypothetical protein [Ramlibacter sp. WS9]|uniref:hypothetical protein n=1 Tax=Ramlibacter sp. WS9 TaxID=1882741 RepID=UPI0011417748|nr:hypothetical protein [Ramlibacter sp. WS9]ROZ64940.1 hypothetical protein EEB15_27720 [Ramlibacter sp. WS9]
MTIALTPRWQSRRLTVAPGAPLFDPVLVQERGLLIAGGPDALSVFAVGDRQYEWFTISKKSWITGFAVSASSLYVQDGPVLINYDLTLGKPFSAVNLSTSVHWSIDDGEPWPPADIYPLAGNDAMLHGELIAAREAHASALLSASPDQAAARTAALQTAQLNARGIDFSPPVVRKYQVEGRRSGQVFSLCMDGRVIALDTALEEPVSLGSDVPLRPELVLAEVPRSGGNVDCFLYYVTAVGGIKAISATGDLAALTGWSATAAPVAARVVPLRFRDGMLLGGGILGAAFFARTLDAAKPPLLTLDGPAEGWRDYDISPKDKLLLVTDGVKSRLASYDPTAMSRLRWKPDRVSERDAHVVFLATGAGGCCTETASPKLILEMEKLAPGNEHTTRVRALLANTVDTTDPAMTSNYPPPASVLDQGKLESGPNPAWLPAIDWLPCKPVVAQQNLYAVVCAKPASGAWTYSVAAFSLGPQLPGLLSKADTELARLRRLAVALELQVNRRDGFPVKPDQAIRDSYPYRDARLMFELTPGGRREAKTNAQGVVRFDAAHAGASVTAMVPGSSSCTSATLTPGEAKTIVISISPA